jgi:hypothetical protein
LQKIVTYYTLDDALASDIVPESIKNVILDPQAERKTIVLQLNNAWWTVVGYADKSGRTYVKREHTNEVDERDKIMYFIGNRYLPGKGIEVLSIEDDKEYGLWTVNSEGVTHIALAEYSYKAKAEKMVENTQEFVMRHGLAASSHLQNGKWIGDVTDNDGLWTAMYAAGEFMRYSSLKDNQFPDEEVSKARDSALRSLKAILLISNIPMRDATIDAKIRHYNNTRTGKGEKLSATFLK